MEQAIKPLPDAFLRRMKSLLGSEEEFNEFLQSFQRPPERGLRLNLRKLSELEAFSGHDAAVIRYTELIREFGLTPIPEASSLSFAGHTWYREFFLPGEEELAVGDHVVRPGKHPYHEAGLYYIQSPEAMQVVNHLGIRPFDRVLDLCSSPGGKATQAADMLSENAGGFIVCNEYEAKRARTLSSNIERMGIPFSLVLNESTEHLAETYPEYFTRIIVDAPCSGEGMFRKNPETIAEWSEASVAHCAGLQKRIAADAVRMLAPGGRMSYSTCTYEREENEEIIAYLLERFPELHCVYQKRHWPHHDRGEGHFCAILEKDGTDPLEVLAQKAASDAYLPELSAGKRKALSIREQDCLIPEHFPDFRGLRVFRAGIVIAEEKGKQTVPAHAKSHALPVSALEEPLLILKTPKEAEAYLRGMQLSLPEYSHIKGWCRVSYRGAVLGYGKSSSGKIKNHFPKGLRWN